VDAGKNGAHHWACDGYLSQMKGDVAGVAHHACKDFDQPQGDYRPGDTTTTTSDRTHLWATKHPQKRVERSSSLRAPRTTRLPKTKPKNMKFKPANSRYE